MVAAAVESVVSVVPELPLVIVLLPPPIPPVPMIIHNHLVLHLHISKAIRGSYATYISRL